jgi:hypothetical protein
MWSLKMSKKEEKRRELLKWTAPAVVVVVVPEHALLTNVKWENPTPPDK